MASSLAPTRYVPDVLDSPEPAIEAIDRAFAFLVDDYGFERVHPTSPRGEPVAPSAHARYETSDACVQVTWFRGELEAYIGVRRRLWRDRSYMLAEVADLLEVRQELGPYPYYAHAPEELERGVHQFARFVRTYGPRVWGHADVQKHLAERQAALSREWTAYYSGKGPRPRTGKLP